MTEVPLQVTSNFFTTTIDGPPTPSGMRHVGIQQLDHGYTVQVGCKSFAIETKEQLLEKLTAYINNPQEVELKYYSGELFKHDGGNNS